jgi:diguanylate cyclase (GGDEF)-like protein
MARILIIDDDPGLRKTLSDILRVKGFEPQTASNGAEGIIALGQGLTDIVILDLGLPDMPGIAVLEKVKAASPSSEIIILTGNATLDSAIDATNRGAFSYLLKPCDIDQLLLHISRATEKRQASERIIRQNAELQRVNAELKTLYEVSSSLTSSLDTAVLFPELLAKITDIGIFSVKRKACIFLRNCEGIGLAANVGMLPDAVLRCSRVGMGECLCGLVAATGKMLVSKDSHFDERHSIRYEGMTRHGHIVVPLMVAGETVGVMCLYVAPDLEVDERILQLLSTLGGQIGIAIMNAKLYEETKAFSLHDPLTGLGNRRLLDIYIDKRIGFAKRHGQRFSVLMLDIDHFKKFNDTYGHPEGDRLLAKLANILVEEMRCADWVFRYGGEEFLILLPDTGATEAAEAAERLRQAVEEQTGMTVSIGVAGHGLKDDRESLIERVDSALYRAKEGGRNRTEVDVDGGGWE